MAPALQKKKKIVEQSSQEILSERKKYNDEMLKAEQTEAREHNLRIGMLSETIRRIQNLDNKMRARKLKFLKDQDWKEYLRAENLPNACVPQELNSYLFRFTTREREYLTQEFQWILRTNERSILCHVKRIPDSTIKNIRSQIPNIGKHFVDKLHELIKIIFKIDRALETVSGDLYKEIKEIKSSYRDLASKYTDILTFYNLSNVERNMVSINPTEAVYEYVSDILTMHLWSYRNVPKEPLEKKFKEFPMNSLNAELKIPKGVECDKSAIRGLWLQYDLLSSETPTSAMTNHPGLFPDLKQSEENCFEIKTGMKKILLELMIKDYLAFEELQKQKAEEELENQSADKNNVIKPKRRFIKLNSKELNQPEHVQITLDANGKKVLQPLVTFEEFVTNSYNEQKVKDVEDRQSGKKPHNINKKSEKRDSVPYADENTCVNVDGVYTAYMEYLHKKRQEGISAEYLPLEEFDINMRKYIVNGGVFPIHHLERAMQPREFINNMTLTSKNLPSTLIYKDFYASYEPPPKHDLDIETNEEPIKESIVVIKRKTIAKNAPDDNNKIDHENKSNENNDENDKTIETNESNDFTKFESREKDEKKLQEELALDKKNQDKLIEINITLPNITNWWHPPIVCRWEPWEESPEFMNLDPRQQYYNLNYEAHHEAKRRKLFNAPFVKNENIPTNYDDFNVYDIPSKYSKKTLVTKLILPRLPENFKFEYEKKMEILENQKHERMIASQKVEDAKMAKNVVSNEPIEETYKQYHLVKPEQIKHEPPRDLFRKKIKLPPITFNNDVKIEIGQGDDQHFVLFSKLLQELEHDVESEKPTFIETVITPEARLSHIEYVKASSMSNSMRKSKSSHLSKTKNSSKDSKKSKQKSSIVTVEEVEEVPIIFKHKPKFKYELTPHTLGKWSTRDIYLTQYNPESKRITFKTGKFGIFAFVVERYSNLPLKHWNLKPDPENPNSSVILTILTNQMIELTITITSKGFKLSVIKPTTFDIPYPKETIHLKVLKAAMIDIGLNIFPELDAVEYIEGIVEKQGSMEFHSYSCIGPFCLTHEFTRSDYNQESTYDTVIMNCYEIISGFGNIIMIKPECVSFIEVKKIGPDPDNLKTSYTSKSSDKEFIPDLHNLLTTTSVEPSKSKQEKTNPMLAWNTTRAMKYIRPFSFSS